MVKFRCINNCVRPENNLNDVLPNLPLKEYREERVAELLSAMHSVSNPAIPFNPLFFKEDIRS